MAKKAAINSDEIYAIVEKLRKEPKDSSRKKGKFHFSNATTLKALRIHRHLRALEKEILDQAEAKNIQQLVTLRMDPSSKQVVISIRNDEIHYNRVAYISAREFSFLRKNPSVVKILRKCQAWKDVA